MSLKYYKMFRILMVSVWLFTPLSASTEIRIVLWFGLDLQDSFLERAKNAGYNHVLVVFDPEPSSLWQNGEYTNADGGGFRTRIRQAFLKTHSKGLKMIPGFSSGSRSSSWMLKLGNNSQIKWTPLITTDLMARTENLLTGSNKNEFIINENAIDLMGDLQPSFL